jgi:hypothetical protein
LVNNIEKFNVRFSFYKSFKNSNKLEINKCFDYIFKENLNKYYLLYRNNQIEMLTNQFNITDEFFNFEFLTGEIKELYLKEKFFSENVIRLLKNNNFFVDPNITYAFEEQRDKNLNQILVFAISLLIIVFINIGYEKLNRKQVSKFINEFIRRA